MFSNLKLNLKKYIFVSNYIKNCFWIYIFLKQILTIIIIMDKILENKSFLYVFNSHVLFFSMGAFAKEHD